jgi:membrane protein
MSYPAESIRSRAGTSSALERVQRLIQKAKQDDILGLAAEIAYHWIFAIPPMLILMVLTGAFLDKVADVNVVGELRTRIDERAPADTASVLNRLLDNAVAEVGNGTVSLGVLLAAIIAIWSGSNGIVALMKALNRVAGIEERRTYVRKRLLSIGLTLLLVGILNAAFVILVYGRQIGERVANELSAGRLFEIGWTLALWPMAIVALALTIAFVYAAAPSSGIPIRWVTPGTVAATALWLLLVLGFGTYLRFSDPGSAYGVLGGVIVLMFFLYLTAAVLLLGAEVDAASE